MPNTAKASADGVLYKDLRYRAARNLEHQLECLDVLTKVERSWFQRLTAKMSSSLRPLVRQGSMLREDLMADESKWRSTEFATLDRVQNGLGDLRNSLIEQSADEALFKKKSLQKFDRKCLTSKGASAWVTGIAGMDLEKGKSLSCTLHGLTSASVDYATIRRWISDGAWYPNVTTLARCSADWLGSKNKSLWIVTEVLYATEFIVEGRSGLLARVNAKIPTGVPGLTVGGDFTLKYVNDNAVELKAKPNEHFIIAYRTMRVDYSPDGTVLAVRSPEDTGLHGADNYPYERNLKLMKGIIKRKISFLELNLKLMKRIIKRKISFFDFS